MNKLVLIENYRSISVLRIEINYAFNPYIICENIVGKGNLVFSSNNRNQIS